MSLTTAYMDIAFLRVLRWCWATIPAALLHLFVVPAHGQVSFAPCGKMNQVYGPHNSNPCQVMSEDASIGDYEPIQERDYLLELWADLGGATLRPLAGARVSLRSSCISSALNRTKFEFAGILGGTVMRFQLRAWETEGGAATSWEAATLRGESSVLSGKIGGVDGGGTPVIGDVLSFPSFNVHYSEDITVVHQPMSVETLAGHDAIFSVEVTPGSGATYRWRRDGLPLSDGLNIIGTRSNTLWIRGVTFGDRGAYSAQVAGRCNSILSANAILSVWECPWNLSETDVTLGAGATNMAFEVTSLPGANWFAEATVPWMDVEKTTGSTADTYVSVVAKPNTGEFCRVGSVLIGNLAQLQVADPSRTPDLPLAQGVGGDGVAVRLSPDGYPFFLEGVSLNLMNLTTQVQRIPTTLGVRIYIGNQDGPERLIRDNLELLTCELGARSNAWCELELPGAPIEITSGDLFIEFIWNTPSQPVVGAVRVSSEENRSWARESGKWIPLARYPDPSFRNVNIMATASGSVGCPTSRVIVRQTGSRGDGQCVSPITIRPFGNRWILEATEEIGVVFLLQSSLDLKDWIPIEEKPVERTGSLQFQVPRSSNSASGFFRLVKITR